MFNETALEWHYWKDEKPARNRYVVCWHASSKRYDISIFGGHYSCHTDGPPTKWAYLPTQREMVG